MQSLTEKFTLLRQHLKAGMYSMRQTGFDPVYYLVFPASEILRAKQMLPEILANLKLDGYTPRVFSISECLNTWFRSHPRLAQWQKELLRRNNDREIFRMQFSQKLERDEVITNALKAEIEAAAQSHKGLLLVSDLEALHPFLHFSGVEQQLVGEFKVPTVVLYPGSRGGAYSLRFLGVHVENGNYRSTHIG